MKTFLAIVILVTSVPCAAQQGTTGDFTGRATTDGHPLAGVTVTLTSDALAGARTTTTGDNGGFRFSFLPPGDYVIRLDFQGFASATKHLRLSLAESARADVEMQPASVSEEITVEAPQRAAGNAAIETTFMAPLLQLLPGARDIRAAAQRSSDVYASGNRNLLIIAGAPSWDSLFLIDGVAANEYLSGQPHDVILEDAIQEIAVFTGGISAEYGRFTGGIVSAVTKSGGNVFSGSLRQKLTDDAWSSRTPWPGRPTARHHVNSALEATLGGYAVKDRLWFFAASRFAHSTVRRFTSLTNIAYATSTQDQRWEGKLTAQITPAQAIIASFSKSAIDEANVTHPRTTGSVLDLGALIPERWQPARLASLTYAGTFSMRSVAEIQYSQKRYALRGNGGRSNDPIVGTLIAVSGRSLNAPFGCGICGDDARNSNSWWAKSSNYFNTRWGNHTAVAGGEEFDEWRTNAGTRSASEFTIQTGSVRIVGGNAYPLFGPSTLILWTHHYAGDQGSRLQTASGYVNDRWDINSRWSANLGVRYDRNNDRDAAGRLISNRGTFSPRLGAAFDIQNDGRQQLRASYGRYSAKMLEGAGAAQQVGVFNQYGWRYGGPVINGFASSGNQLEPPREALVQLFQWFASVGGIRSDTFLRFITNPNGSSVYHGSLKTPSVDERSVGYALHWPSAELRIDAVARDWHNFYAVRSDKSTGQETDARGNLLDVAWILNDNGETRRTYRALEMQGSWQLRAINLGGRYTLSKLRGNDDEEDGVNNTGARNCPLSFCYPELLGYARRRPVGWLAQDVRHRARLWAAYHEGRLSLAVLQWFDSGHPYSAEAEIDPKAVLRNPGYTLNQSSTGPYFFSGRGAYRTDNVFSTDLSLQYDIALGSTRVFVKGDTLNVFNRAAIVAPGTDVADAFNSGGGLLPFNPFTDVPVEGIHYRLSPAFGKATGPESYQAPRTFQVALGARF